MDLIQLTAGRRPGTDSPERKPPWLKVRAPGGRNYAEIRRLMRELRLHPVCEEARCPNVGECWEHRAATFMILGDVCTRNCAYCAVAHGTPAEYDPDEPARLAEAVAQIGLEHVVITSVDRDDLPNGGAEIFAGCVVEIRKRLPEISIEVLIPDFKGNWKALADVVDGRPDVLNHNMESIARLYNQVRPQAKYERSLELLARVKHHDPTMRTKSGLMVGLGETTDELLGTMRDLRRSACDLLTLGQYLCPSPLHLPVQRFYHPDEFVLLKREGEAMGFIQVEAGPLVRSSYHAAAQEAAVRT